MGRSDASDFLALLGRALVAGTPAQRQALRARLDVDAALIGRIAKHRLLVPTLRLLQGYAAAESSWLPELRAQALAAAEGSLAQTVLLRGLVSALEGAGLAVLAWKGPALSQITWGDPASRVFSDLDLVVRPMDLDAAEAELQRLGWRRRGDLTARQAHAIQRWLGAMEWTGGSDAEMLLELHTAFAAPRHPGNLDPSTVLARAASVEVAGITVRTPDAADTLALLAQHGTKHGWTILEELVTFARLATRSPSALLEGYRRSEDVGGERAVLLAVRLMLRLFEIAPPAELGDAIARWPDGARLEAQVLERLATDQTGWHPTLGWSLAWTSRRADQLHLISSSLFAPTQQEWEAIRLPDALVGLYPVVRVGRLAMKVVSGRWSGVGNGRS